MGDEVDRPQTYAELEAELRQRVEDSFIVDASKLDGDELGRTKKHVVLKGYALRGLISDGCRAAGVSRQRWYEWVRDDTVFAEYAVEAKDFAIESLERRALQRGMEMSDRLLEFMLKHGKPQTYKDKTEISGPNGQPLSAVIAVSPVVILPDNGRSTPPPALDEPKV